MVLWLRMYALAVCCSEKLRHIPINSDIVCAEGTTLYEVNCTTNNRCVCPKLNGTK